MSFINIDIKPNSTIIEKFSNNISLKGGSIKNVIGSTTDKYIQFNSNGVITINYYLECDILIVGGGGSGGKQIGGGGGGGAVVYIKNFIINRGEYDVVVGKGGSQNTNENLGNKGGDSKVFEFVAEGGGASASYPNNGGFGGSGGGAGADEYFGSGERDFPIGGSKGTLSTLNRYTNGIIYGNRGGNGLTRTEGYLGGGGGGGAGQPGEHGNILNKGAGGKGGDGIQINITGEDLYWGAGGGGAQYGSRDGGIFSRAGNGGLGGGGGGSSAAGYLGSGGTGGLNNGFGANNQIGGAGGANTGSGGGGGGWFGNGPAGGAGGSGVVIIRYKDNINYSITDNSANLLLTQYTFNSDYNSNNLKYCYKEIFDSSFDMGNVTITKNDITFSITSSTTQLTKFSNNKFKTNGELIDTYLVGEKINLKFNSSFVLKKIIFVAANRINAPAEWSINGIDKTATSQDYDVIEGKSENYCVKFYNENTISTDTYEIIFKKTLGGSNLNFYKMVLFEGTTPTVESTAKRSINSY